MTAPRVLVLACGALAREILFLLPPERFPTIDLHCLPASLHNHPQRIGPALRAALAERAGKYDRILIGYGDCGSGGAVDAVAAEFGATRLPGPHCYAFFHGIAAFDRLGDADMRSFYLTDFLARQFRTLIWEGLGLDRHPELRDAYFAHYEKVVFLAQTEDAALTAAAQAAAAQLRLGFERRFVGYGDLATALLLATAESGGATSSSDRRSLATPSNACITPAPTISAPPRM